MFWRNYFYRVDLLKRAAGIDENKGKEQGNEGDGDEVCDHVDQKDDQVDEEAITAALISSIDVSLAHLSSSSSSSQSLQSAVGGEDEESDPNVEDTILIETGIDDLVSDDVDVEIVDE